MKKFVVTLGEALVDWVCLERTLDFSLASTFTRAPGGAPANVAVALSRLGVPARFVGGFSDDPWGAWLRELLAAEGVDLSCAVRVRESNTRHAYVLTSPEGERVFRGFTAASCADAGILPEGLSAETLRNAGTLVFGSVLQSSANGAAVVDKLLEESQRTGVLTVYDPNYRAPFWAGPEEAKRFILRTMDRVDVLKLSDDEVLWLSGQSDVRDAARWARDRSEAKLVAVTLGSKGSVFLTARGEGFVPGVNVRSLDATGAGDAFLAGLVRALHELGGREAVQDLSEEFCTQAFRRANALGALATLKPGAMSGLPTLAELEAFSDK